MQINHLFRLYFKFLVSRKKRNLSATNQAWALQQYEVAIFDLFCFLSNSVQQTVFELCGHSQLSLAEMTQILGDLESFGMIHFLDQSAQHPERVRFSVTRLMSGLFSNRLLGFKMNSISLIVENDFRLYAYSNFRHTKYLLALFLELKVFFPGMLIAKFVQEKIKVASRRGIEAVQILNFIAKNLHPALYSRKLKQMTKNSQGGLD